MVILINISLFFVQQRRAADELSRREGGTGGGREGGREQGGEGGRDVRGSTTYTESLSLSLSISLSLSFSLFQKLREVETEREELIDNHQVVN
jgi:hypothetical protein